MLKGKTALVTGSTSGIGQGILSAFAGAGCHIVMNGFGDEKEIETNRMRLQEEHGIRVLYSSADMSKPESIEAMVRQAETESGGIDILVNCAGIQFVSPVDEFPPDKWEAVIAINLSSAFYTIRGALPKMKEKKWGRIINIASAHGLVASPFKSAYVAAKHGMVGLTKTVALEIAEQGITCNAICPGFVKTPLVDNQIADQARAHKMDEQTVIRDVILASQPTKKFVGIEEINALALLLASDQAASINGSALAIDGGWTAR